MDDRSTLIHSARLVTDGAVVEEGWVLFGGSSIAATGFGDSWRAVVADAHPGSIAVVDAAGGWLTPGFVDIHGHGGGGASFDDGPDAIRTALALHSAHGTTRFVLSLVTASIATLESELAAVAALARTDPRVIGSHLEGPFLDPGHKGAHDPALLVNAGRDAVDRLLAAAGGSLKQITLAPEREGGMDAVRRFTEAGVAVAVGHTGADYAQTLAAFDAGASILTHAFNGMDGIHHRAPGPVAAATRTPGVTIELINDGIHVHPEVVRLTFAGAPGRVALISDAMAAAGSTDGDYLLGGLAVTVRDGVARLTVGDSIAGSTLTLDDALRRAVVEVGIDVGTAVRALTETPARAIGRGNDLGRLAPGYAADAVLLDDTFAVLAVWSDGRVIRPTASTSANDTTRMPT
ncbi:N-acetylglucosamine-6-phosphate deacetylase [Diaminobutyricibacter tongyongensis]|uniref:N-acetylglucosamine-6-phosphate deacetylase n=1 Tax=Leifsonia tongyongensis TaxID=1268043 RepID=A0A6L9XSK3_9MICO|nr:N-acetylglucosamine-6-phosphate deacetylase [Diaminobutyricibacter tongyongensis]NEN04391.1 N-acetylglucosamine-6-phosphate deacetylase [Diaminobutyricibacter tongyongensis]